MFNCIYLFHHLSICIIIVKFILIALQANPVLASSIRSVIMSFHRLASQVIYLLLWCWDILNRTYYWSRTQAKAHFFVFNLKRILCSKWRAPQLSWPWEWPLPSVKACRNLLFVLLYVFTPCASALDRLSYEPVGKVLSLSVLSQLFPSSPNTTNNYRSRFSEVD